MKRFGIKEIIFAAIVSVGMNVVSFIAVPLATAIPVPGARTLLIAPFYGVLMVIAILKVPRFGMPTLVAVFTGAVMLFISPTIFFFLTTSAVLSELITFVVFRGYRAKWAPVVLSGLYCGFQVPFGVLFGSIFVGDYVAAFVVTVPVMTGMFLAAFLLGALGGMVGRKIGAELREIGKL